MVLVRWEGSGSSESPFLYCSVTSLQIAPEDASSPLATVQFQKPKRGKYCLLPAHLRCGHGRDLSRGSDTVNGTSCLG